MEESKGKKSEVKEVRTELPEEKVKCLGVLNIESVAKKNIPLSQINAEAGNYVILNLGGFEKIYLVDMKNAVAAARGVNNSGFGAFLAPGQSWLLGSATGAIGGGLSYGKGNAFNATRLGTTFIVLGSDSDGMIFKLPEPSKQTKEPEKAIEKPLSEEKRVVIEIITPQLQPAPQPQVISEPEKRKKNRKRKILADIILFLIGNNI